MLNIAHGEQMRRVLSMKYIVLAVAALALQLLLLLPAQAAGARVNAFDRAFGPVHCSAKGVCIIKENVGGVITVFQAAARAVNKCNLQVVIAGPSYSACTIFADKAREHVCITPQAEFGFHQAFIADAFGKMVPDRIDPLPGNSRDIYNW